VTHGADEEQPCGAMIPIIHAGARLSWERGSLRIPSNRMQEGPALCIEILQHLKNQLRNQAASNRI
jgi:hypothetical protein